MKYNELIEWFDFGRVNEKVDDSQLMNKIFGGAAINRSLVEGLREHG
jgi:hypothetical protein